MISDDIQTVDSQATLDSILRLPRVLLYKHSTRCGTSLRALLEVERYARAQAEIPVYGIDVIRQRGLSGAAEERLGIKHQSPQVILIRQGSPEWHVSHSHITVDALSAAAAATVSD